MINCGDFEYSFVKLYKYVKVQFLIIKLKCEDKNNLETI